MVYREKDNCFTAHYLSGSRKQFPALFKSAAACTRLYISFRHTVGYIQFSVFWYFR